MANFDFPNSPTLGQIYSLNGATFKWDGQAWMGGPISDIIGGGGGGGGGASITVSDTPPASPEVNSLWWEADSGKLYLFFDDGTSQQWVQVNYAVSATGGGGGAGTAATTTFTPAGNLAATNVQAAIVELDTEKVAKAGDTMGPLTVTVDSGNTELSVDDTGPLTAPNAAMIAWKRSGQPRWRMFLDQADSGGGSHLKFARYSTSGSYIENALSMNRSDGTITVTKDLGVGGQVITNGAITQNSPSHAYLTLNKAAGAFQNIVHGTRAGLSRWGVLPGDSAAESTGNAGSNFAIQRFNDAGTFIDQPFWISRANGGIAVAYDGPTKPTAGSWAASSDRRIKRSIKDYEPGLDEILRLRPVSYKFKRELKRGGDPEARHVGMIAQEIEQVLPETVTRDRFEEGDIKLDDGRTFDPTNITYALVNAVKALKAEIDDLRAQLEARDV